MARWLVAASALLGVATYETRAAAQACCVGGSGLTPGWLATHEQFLVGAQLRTTATHGAYPVSGPFYVPPPGRDLRFETSVFGSVRVLPRGQVSALLPLVVTRRRAGGITETGEAFGDAVLTGRYDFMRAGESTVIPGIALLAGMIAPTGRPPDRGTGLLAPDVTGTGAWEGNLGLSVEQTWSGFIAHATALVGVRAPRDVLGVTQSLAPRVLGLVAAGYVFDGETTLLGTITASGEGDAKLGGESAPGTGFRTTQAALLVVVPVTDLWRLRTAVFTDLPYEPFGENRPAVFGTSLSLTRSWM